MQEIKQSLAAVQEFIQNKELSVGKYGGRGEDEKKRSISFIPLGFPFAQEVLKVFPALLDPAAEDITESYVLPGGEKKKKEEENSYFLLCFQSAVTVLLDDPVLSLCNSKILLSRRNGV